MSLALRFVAVVITSIACFGQGQVVFANRVTGLFDAQVTIAGTNPAQGPGPGWSAQLYLQQGMALTPLLPVQSFRAAGTGAAAIADRYLEGQPLVEVPGVAPGSPATFVMRAWMTAAGSYDAAKAAGQWGESAPFTVTVGGGTLPPANLTTLQAFAIPIFPEPSTFVLGTVGGVVLLFGRRLRR